MFLKCKCVAGGDVEVVRANCCRLLKVPVLIKHLLQYTNMTQHIVPIRPPPFIRPLDISLSILKRTFCNFIYVFCYYILSVFFFFFQLKGREAFGPVPWRSLDDQNANTSSRDHNDRPIGVENNTKFGL